MGLARMRAQGRARRSADSEVVDPLEGSAAVAADDGVTVAAHERCVDGFAAGGAVKLGGSFGGHLQVQYSGIGQGYLSGAGRSPRV